MPALYQTRLFPPVGAVVYNAYGQYVYRVVARNPDEFGREITVEMLDHDRTSRDHYPGGYMAWPHGVGSRWSHSTSLSNRDEILSMPNTPDAWTVAQWDEYVAAAPNVADATSRIEQAVMAGVDFAALLVLRDAREGR